MYEAQLTHFQAFCWSNEEDALDQLEPVAKFKWGNFLPSCENPNHVNSNEMTGFRPRQKAEQQ